MIKEFRNGSTTEMPFDFFGRLSSHETCFDKINTIVRIYARYPTSPGTKWRSASIQSVDKPITTYDVWLHTHEKSLMYFHYPVAIPSTGKNRLLLWQRKGTAIHSLAGGSYEM